MLTRPPRTMTMDNTAAKIGREIKKRENKGSFPVQLFICEFVNL
jgi:hypothetical protein